MSSPHEQGVPVQIGYEPDSIPEETAAHLAGLTAKIDKAVERMANATDPSTRPGASASAEQLVTLAAPDLSKYGRAVSESDEYLITKRRWTGVGGYLPPTEQNSYQRQAMNETAIKGGFNFNLFPKGEIDNFSVTRFAMALQRSQGAEGNLAFNKWAPWESQYYYALGRYSEKAQGDMVSGQDGGFLAPELWSNRFIDQIYPQLALSRLPITRVPMGTRVTHVPRLSNNIAISYSAENAAITANQAQFQQLSFTARKQTFLVQISNELIRDSNPAAEAVLTNNATRYLAIDRDKQALIGNGQAGAPTGLLNTTNVTTNNSLFSSPVVFTDFNTGIGKVEDLNASSNVPLGQAVCSGVVGPVAMKATIMGLKDTTNNRIMYGYGLRDLRGAPRLDGSAILDGLYGVDNWVLTNILAGSAGSRNVFFGDWQHLWIMERQDVEIVSSNVAGTAFQNDQTWVRGITRYDVGVAHPEAFHVGTNF